MEEDEADARFSSVSDNLAVKSDWKQADFGHFHPIWTQQASINKKMLVINRIILIIKHFLHIFMNDTKFKISLKSVRTGLIYKENGKTLFIDSEMLAEPSSIAIHKTTELFWNPPNEYEVITANERDRIFKNVVNYFIENGWHVDEVKISKSPSEQNKVIHDILESYRKKGWNIAKVEISPPSDSNYPSASGPNN